MSKKQSVDARSGMIPMDLWDHARGYLSLKELYLTRAVSTKWREIKNVEIPLTVRTTTPLPPFYCPYPKITELRAHYSLDGNEV